jgi:hypothetical protein
VAPARVAAVAKNGLVLFRRRDRTGSGATRPRRRPADRDVAGCPARRRRFGGRAACAALWQFGRRAFRCERTRSGAAARGRPPRAKDFCRGQRRVGQKSGISKKSRERAEFPRSCGAAWIGRNCRRGRERVYTPERRRAGIADTLTPCPSPASRARGDFGLRARLPLRGRGEILDSPAPLPHCGRGELLVPRRSPQETAKPGTGLMPIPGLACRGNSSVAGYGAGGLNVTRFCVLRRAAGTAGHGRGPRRRSRRSGCRAADREARTLYRASRPR